MSYEILTGDLGEDKSSKKPSNKKMGKIKQLTKVNPVYIHITLILVIVGLLFLYFLDDFEFDFQKSQKEEIVTLIGNLKEFNESYSGNIDITASNFKLEIPSGEFDVLKADLEIEGFQGFIYLGENSTIVIEGIAKKIEYGKNKINLNGDNFRFTSGKKVSMNLFFEKLDLNFETGRVKIDESFNYDFKNTNISLSKFNSSFNYDGTFLFSGPMEVFILYSQNPKLLINYKND